MIKLILCLLALLVTSKYSSQIANRLASNNIPIAVGSPTNFLWVKPNSIPTSQIYTSTWDSIQQIKDIRDSIWNRYTKIQTDSRYKLSTAVTSLTIVGMSLTAGGNTVTISGNDPGFGLSKTGNTLSVNSTVMMGISTANDSLASVRVSLGLKLNSSDFTYTNLSGKPTLATVATSGSYNDLSNKPIIPTINGSGFVKSTGTVITYDNNSYLTSYTPTLSLSGQTLTAGGNSIVIPTQTTVLTSSQVTAALLYVPYNSSNPSGYISSYSETDPLFDTKFATKSTTGLVEGTNLYFTTARTRTTVSAGTSISYNNSTGVITNSSPDQVVSIASSNTNIVISGAYPSFTAQYVTTPKVNNYVTRPLTTSFSISATQDNYVDYSVYSQVSSALTGTNTADVFLEISTTSGGTYTTIANGGVMAAGVLSTNGGSNCLSGLVPAGYWVRLRTTATGANSASAVFIYKYGRENNE